MTFDPWRMLTFPRMRRELPFVIKPRYILVVVAITVFLAISVVLVHLMKNKDQAKVREITNQVFLDIHMDDQHIGRIVIGLYGLVVPKTVENFRALCTGENGKTLSGRRLHYKGTRFYRIIPGFLIQGGDISKGDGKGNESIYGGTFSDENFNIRHQHAGIVSMVNFGPDSNGSQFFITTIKTSWLDGEHVAFGKVVQGMDTVYAIEGGAGTYSGNPRKKVLIFDSGEIPMNNNKPSSGH